MPRPKTTADLDEMRRRVDGAVADAIETCRRSTILVTASRRRRDNELTSCCAWCGRVALSDDYLDRDETPVFVLWRRERFTHGICPDCARGLQDSASSR